MRTFEKSCYGKLKHDSKELADNAAEYFKSKGLKKKGHIFHSYKCDFCPGWHVGHSSTKKARKFRAAKRLRKERNRAKKLTA